jgi:hypothetical protein
MFSKLNSDFLKSSNSIVVIISIETNQLFNQSTIQPNIGPWLSASRFLGIWLSRFSRNFIIPAEFFPPKEFASTVFCRVNSIPQAGVLLQGLSAECKAFTFQRHHLYAKKYLESIPKIPNKLRLENK